MSTPKGYSSTQKLDREEANFVTVSQAGEHKRALDVRDLSTVTSIASVIAEAGSEVGKIVLAGHTAKIGDRVRMTSGTHNTVELDVIGVEVNAIILSADLATPISTGDTFDILRPLSLTLNQNGQIVVGSSPMLFILDGVNTEVLEDTVTPSNNIPLPVKLTGLTGDLNITAGDLNVQLSDQGVNADVTRIGDGANELGITVSNEAKVADATTHTKLDSIDGNIQDIEARTDVDLSTRASELTLAALNSKVIKCDTDNVVITASVLPTGSATETTLASLNSKVTAIDTDDVTISASALPTGAATQTTSAAILAELALKADLLDTQPVSAAALPLPSGAATEAKQDTGITSLATIAGAIASGQMQVDLVDIAGAATETTLASLDTELGSLDKGAGAVSANTRRVELTTESLAALLPAKDVLHSIFTASNIPGNATLPLELVPSTSGAISEIQVSDTTGAYFEIMVGAAAAEARKFITGPGSDSTIKVNIASSSRISVRRVDDAAATTAGQFMINLVG